MPAHQAPFPQKELMRRSFEEPSIPVSVKRKILLRMTYFQGIWLLHALYLHQQNKVTPHQ